MQFLDFEEPIEELYKHIDAAKESEKKTGIDMTSTIADFENKIQEKRKEIASQLTPWQRVQLSRHPERPYTLYYIESICDEFVELHGDRAFRDDKAIIGGLGKIDGQTFMIIGHQKGKNTKMRQERNFGMAHPEGYRKAIRLMKMAEKFNIPIITFIDTPGAYHGPEAEERGQAQAIAQNLYDMTLLRVPVICYVIGEGASGGALGIGVGDKVIMLENTWYTVISPESCSSILWRSWEFKEEAAKQLRLTSEDMSSFQLIDEVVHEPIGGAHVDPEQMAINLKESILRNWNALKDIDPDTRINGRIEKYSKMGFYTE